MMQEDRVYTFLDGLDDRLDNIRGDILQMKPFPTVKQAYAHVRREAVRQAVMISGDSIDNPGAVLASKSFRPGQPSSVKSLSLDNGKHGSGSRPRASSDGLKCTHCGNLKHTRDTCFKLHGYPDWWNELQAKKRRDAPESTGGKGQAAVATADAPISSLSLSAENPKEATPPTDSGNLGTALCSSSQGENSQSFPNFITNPLLACSLSITQVIICGAGYCGFELCCTHVLYFLFTTGYSYQGDNWAWY
jgi:hypothetical protein